MQIYQDWSWSQSLLAGAKNWTRPDFQTLDKAGRRPSRDPWELRLKGKARTGKILDVT